MAVIVILACLMSSPAECRTIERRAPATMPATVCERQAVTIARHWIEMHDMQWFVRSVGCREDRGL